MDKEKSNIRRHKTSTVVSTVDEAIDYLGFGKFTICLVCTVGIFFMAEATELNLISVISPELRCVWNLTPTRTSILSSMTFLGLFVGNVYWGFLSDVHGRKFVLILGAFTSLYFGVFSTATRGYKMFLLMRFFVGFGLGAAIHLLNYVGELVPGKHRGKSILIVDLYYSLGSLYIGVAAILFMEQAGWRIYILITMLPPFVFLIVSFWLPNSIQYLQVTDKYDQLVKTITSISVMNKIKMPILNLNCSAAKLDRGDVRILLGKDYRWKMCLMAVVFIGGIGNYFTLVLLNTEILTTPGGFCRQQLTTLKLNHNKTLSCHRLTTEDYKRNIIVALAELPGVVLPALLIDSIGRKIYLVVGFAILGAGYLCLNLCLTQQTGIVLMFILRGIVAGVSQVPFVVAVELFPTVVRGTAIGVLTGVTRLFLIAVPFFVQSIFRVSLAATTVFFASLSFLAALVALFLPETKETKLTSS